MYFAASFQSDVCVSCMGKKTLNCYSISSLNHDVYWRQCYESSSCRQRPTHKTSAEPLTHLLCKTHVQLSCNPSLSLCLCASYPVLPTNASLIKHWISGFHLIMNLSKKIKQTWIKDTRKKKQQKHNKVPFYWTSNMGRGKLQHSTSRWKQTHSDWATLEQWGAWHPNMVSMSPCQLYILSVWLQPVSDMPSKHLKLAFYTIYISI